MQIVVINSCAPSRVSRPCPTPNATNRNACSRKNVFCSRYNVMKECWEIETGDRPTFAELRRRLEYILQARSKCHNVSLLVYRCYARIALVRSPQRRNKRTIESTTRAKRNSIRRRPTFDYDTRGKRNLPHIAFTGACLEAI